MDDLSRLLHDAVADVEPVDRLAEIRRRTSRPARRGWVLGAGAGLVAAATVLAGVVVAGGWSGPDDPAPAPEPPQESRAAAAYYLGETPRGTRLYREWSSAPGSADPLAVALALLQGDPADPDYRTPWVDAFAGAAREGGVVTVELSGADVRRRPAGLSPDDARLALQQVVLTVGAALGEPLPVRFELDGEPVTEVLGVPVAGPLHAAPQLEVLALASISEPAEGERVADRFTARGRISSFEGTVVWEVRRGADVLETGFTTAAGWADRLHPWEAQVDVSDLPPGRYTFVVRTDDPSAGEGPGPDVDTREVVVG